MFVLFVTSAVQKQTACPRMPDRRSIRLAEVGDPQIGLLYTLLRCGQLETGLRCKLRAALQALLQTLPKTRLLIHA